MNKQLWIIFLAGLAGPMLADKFAIRYGSGDNAGFIDFQPAGFGLDDVVVAGSVLGAALLMRKVA